MGFGLAPREGLTLLLESRNTEAAMALSARLNALSVCLSGFFGHGFYHAAAMGHKAQNASSALNPNWPCR